jgi:hypothetical protein
MPTVGASEAVMPKAGVVLLVLLGPAGALCQEQELTQAITQCADIDDISDRLDCYDSLRGVAQSKGPRRANAESVVVESSTPGQWVTEVVKDPIDDTTTVSLSLVGNDLQPRLVLRCRQRKLDVLLSWRGRYYWCHGAGRMAQAW